jgi:hypothetical protein
VEVATQVAAVAIPEAVEDTRAAVVEDIRMAAAGRLL